MKAFLALCLAALLATASAEYSFDVISSTIDSVTFEYECDETSECKEPGEEYCGDNQIDTLFCKDHENICEITCLPLKRQEADDTHIYSTSINVAPADRRAGDEITVTLKDNKGKLLANWGVNVFYGGRWVTETVEGAAHWGGSLAVMNTFTDSDYVDKEKLTSGYTDRQGEFTFTAEEPGHYVLYATNKYVRFKVADEEGTVYNCSNGICEEDLGEDEGVCPEDCEKTVDSPPTAIVCGDGVCDAVEKGQCPEDCQTETDKQSQNETPDEVPVPPSPPVVCGDGICNPSEEGQCPEDCQPQMPVSQGGDNTLMIILIVAIIVAVVAVLAFLMMTGRLGGKKPAAVPSTQTQIPASPAPQPKQTQAVSSIKCPKCGTDNTVDNAFCINCGQKLK